ncbi:MAG: denV, Syn33 [Ramlibacter sp.]|uniref:hypothetical protein n=1 Tax=Ramlibacter sp. TaxID=1917967 RepID=UPI00261064A9|nr:hypothetical protein [Ramlibacter sp.]MDB5752119.1 denV, Syn33 [Ramlibacter sp.]
MGQHRGAAPPAGAHLAPEDNRQQVHGFYLHRGSLLHESHYFPLLRPLIHKLQPTALLRVKLNRTARASRPVEYGLHTDVRRPGASTAIYYLNTNNGYTLFEDGQRVASAANRIVLFDASVRHTGASCTDAEYRMVLNINMMPPAGRPVS